MYSSGRISPQDCRLFSSSYDEGSDGGGALSELERRADALRPLFRNDVLLAKLCQYLAETKTCFGLMARLAKGEHWNAISEKQRANMAILLPLVF